MLYAKTVEVRTLEFKVWFGDDRGEFTDQMMKRREAQGDAVTMGRFRDLELKYSFTRSRDATARAKLS